MNIKIATELDRLFHNSPWLLYDNNKLRHAIQSTFRIALEDVSYNHIGELIDKIDNEVLCNYFSKVWQPQTKKFKYSGLKLIDEVNSLNPNNVIDLGCGYNEFKGKINNLIGLDPYNSKADINSTIIDFDTTEQYDVTLCLGSINFGSTDKIIAEVKKAVDLTKQNGLLYFRVNPGHSHEADESNWISFYNWTPNFIINIATLLNVTILDLRNDSNNRIYFVFKK
jgi:hypothetical protein